ncbi:3593_t:CDS:2, partial [Gigaspora rosea]
RPVKATLTGNLIRTLLIQVQKTKVDLELSMTALDKLLKSNELNFAFLAVGPSIFGIYLIYKWIKVLWWKKESLLGGLQGTKVKMQESLRQVERILVNNYSSVSMPFAAQGLVLCHVHQLRSCSLHLPTKNNLRKRFLEDLRDLEDPSMTVNQKILTCERMRRCWAFLNGE